MKINEIVHTKLNISRQAVEQRERQAMELLRVHGAMRGADLAAELGYQNAAGVFGLLNRLLQKGSIARRGYVYHLKDQDPTVPFIGQATARDFFVGTGKMHNLRRWLRDHQDEPASISKIARDTGYSAPSGANLLISSMLESKILRRYQAPEDYGFEWRYQYVDPKLSGITTTPAPPEPVAEEVDDDVLEEMPEPTVEEVADHAGALVAEATAERTDQALAAEMERAELIVAAELTEKYAREFMWVTGSRDTKELVLWLRERMLSGGQ